MNLPVISYVREYFELYFNTYYTKLSKQEVDSIVYGISDKINDKYDLIQLKNGVADNLISQIIGGYVHKNYPDIFKNHIDLKNKVKSVIEKRYRINYSIRTSDLIVERIVSLVDNQYDDVDDKLDDFISSCYKTVTKDLRNAMMQYVMSQIEKYLNKSDTPLLYVDKETVAMIIVKEVMTTNKINAVSLLTGGCNNIIEEYVKKNNKENEEASKQQASQVEPVKKLQEEVFTFNQDPKKSAMDALLSMKSNSVKSKDKANKIKKKAFKRKMTKAVSTLLIIVTLLGIGGNIVEKETARRSDDDAIKKVYAINDFSYSGYYRNQDERYNSMANDVLNFYEQVQELGIENFDSLGFYCLMRNNNLSDQDLDQVLRMIQKNLRDREEYSELEATFCDNLSYLDFIYDRLLAMGCEEIQDERYQKAILAYKHSNYSNHYGIPKDNLYQHEIDTIEEIKDMYRKYCEQYMIALGNRVVIDGKTYYFDDKIDPKRR